MATGQSETINIMQLTLPQLSALQQQLSQEIEVLRGSMQQLSMAQSKYTNSADSLNSLTEETENNELLVPLTSSMYVNGRLADTNKVLVDVGTGYLIEKNIDEAKAFFKRKCDFLQKQMEKIQQPLLEKERMKNATSEVMRMKVQAQLSSQSAPSPVTSS